MALLASCFFIIESIVTADSYLRWFYLRFYMNPVVLLVCQIFMWLKVLQRWLLHRFMKIFSFFIDLVITYAYSRVNRGVADTEVHEFQETENDRNYHDPIRHSSPYCFSAVLPLTYLVEAPEETQKERSDDHNFDLLDESLSLSGRSSIDPSDKDDNLSDQSSLFSSPGYTGHEQGSGNSEIEEEDSEGSSSDDDGDESSDHDSEKDDQEDFRDEFHEMYSERMRWFDMLNYDRTCGSSAIQRKTMEGSLSLWWQKAEKKLLKSIETDFELVYVAQTCLSWEALHHSYAKARQMTMCSGVKWVFHRDACGEFQKFQVLLERFMENERCEEHKRALCFVRAKCGFQGLLHVPKISGRWEDEDGEIRSEGVDVKEVLNAIKKCIGAFHEFVKTETKNSSFWEMIKRSSLWSHPRPVEDPRDFELFVTLTKSLQKKEACLKDLRGKNKGIFKKAYETSHFEEYLNNHEMLFTMIDLKLVSRVLRMPLVSSSQLHWCQEKLDAIDFKDGKVFRACRYLLFPAS